MASEKPTSPPRFLLDSSAITHGANVDPKAAMTTPSVLAEFGPGGATRRRLDLLVSAGLKVQDPTAASLRRVAETAAKAGSASRLSAADQDILALGLDAGRGFVLLSDDYTVQDVARRLGLAVQSIATKGIEHRLDWQPRCTGCGRTFAVDFAATVCPVCGSEVRAKPRRR